LPLIAGKAPPPALPIGPIPGFSRENREFFSIFLDKFRFSLENGETKQAFASQFPVGRINGELFGLTGE
jgi:hypothetical protein